MVFKKKSKKNRKAGRFKTVHIGATGGVVMTGYNILWGDDAIPGALGSPIQNLIGGPGTGMYGQPMEAKVTKALKSLTIKATKIENWYPLVVGAMVTASPRIPLLSIVAKPMDNAIKNATKGKMGL